jgi:hypothetical protein
LVLLAVCRTLPVQFAVSYKKTVTGGTEIVFFF